MVVIGSSALEPTSITAIASSTSRTPSDHSIACHLCLHESGVLTQVVETNAVTGMTIMADTTGY